MILHCSTGVELKDLQDLVVRRLPPRFQRASFSGSAGKVGPGMRDQNLNVRFVKHFSITCLHQDWKTLNRLHYGMACLTWAGQGILMTLPSMTSG